MKFSQMKQSKYLRKEDVEDDTVMTIKNLQLEDMPGNSGEQRWVLYFKEQSKGMVLNATTLGVLERTFDNNSENSLGKKIVLYVDENVQYKGQVVGGLRLRSVKKPALVPAKESPVEQVEEEFDDVIP